MVYDNVTIRKLNKPSIQHLSLRKKKKRRVEQLIIFACIRCRGKVLTEPLPSNDRRDMHTDTQTDRRDL
jgi:hypothetical protein